MKRFRLADLCDDPRWRHAAFPITASRTYLAHAAVAPLPACVVAAITRYATRAAGESQFAYLHEGIEHETRNLLARLLHATPDEIAFVSSTSAGIGTVAAGLDWQSGDNVIVAEGDFPANVYPWLDLRRRGVAVKRIPWRPDTAVGISAIKPLIDRRTRLVSLSSIHYLSGAPVDTCCIGEFLRSRGVLFCVDAIQSLGAHPCTVEAVDFLAADAHKWLLGPQGIGVLYVRAAHFDRLHPPLVGWRSVPEPEHYHADRFALAETARRYEPGSLNVLGLVGLHTSLKLLLQVGTTEISRHIHALRTSLATELQRKGYRVLGPAATLLPTGIVSFSDPRRDMTHLYRQLNEQKVVVSARKTPTGDACLRVSPHFYSVADDMEQLLSHC